MKRIAIFFIRIYQHAIAPHVVQSCRFEPTCSHYAVEAIKIHGAWRGSRLAFHRIAKCGPADHITHDPVPPVVK